MYQLMHGVKHIDGQGWVHIDINNSGLYQLIE
jgi:hypothetical protein